MATKIVTIVQGQSIWDIAIQEYGSVTSVFDFIDDNAFPQGLDTLLTPGQKVKIISAPSDMGVLMYIQANNITVVGGQYLSQVLSYAYGSQPIEVVNNGGDNWTFNVPLSAINYIGDFSLGYAKVTMVFYQSGTPAFVLNNHRINTPTSFNYSGNGAGVYIFTIVYYSPNDIAMLDTSLYVMVDGAGHVIRQANFNGVENVMVSGIHVSLDAIAVINNCTVAYTFIGADNVNNQPGAYVPLSSSGLSMDDMLPLYTEVGVILVALFDPAQWPDAGAAINFTYSQTAAAFITNN